jgi:hypothetical protein
MAEERRMLRQRGGQGRSLAHGIRNAQQRAPQGRILLLFAQAFQGLRDRNGRVQQRPHLARQARDFLSLDTAAGAKFPLCGGGRRGLGLRRTRRGA